MSTVRLRRLTADNAKLQDYVRRHPRVRLIQMDGNPPERYQVEYRIKSLRMVDSELQMVQSHLVEVALPLNYPRIPPQCRMLTPVFHPNIAPHAICVGDHWGAGESLESIVIRIGEMLAYQSYNVKSPLNGEAARWVEQNKHRLPLDAVSLLPEEEQAKRSEGPAVDANARPEVAPSATAPIKQQPDVSDNSEQTSSASVSKDNAITKSQIVTACPGCGARYRVSTDFAGRNVSWQKCGRSFKCTPTVQSIS